MSEDLAVGLALTTVRSDETLALVRAVLKEPIRPGSVSVTFQGAPEVGRILGRALDEVARKHDYQGLVFGWGSGRGISRGRNAAFAALPDAVTWAWTPNDTSRPPRGWVSAVREAMAHVDSSVAALAMDYVAEGRLRRLVSDAPALSGWALWRAIEPAVVWRRQTVHELGGFDVRLGTGAPTWAQSGEGTDLFCRMRDAGLGVATLPLEVEGRQHSLGASNGVRRRKDFYYGIGFGCVARRHFPLGRGLVAVATPLLKLATRRPLEGETARVGPTLATVAGRAVGLALGEHCLKQMMRGDHWA